MLEPVTAIAGTLTLLRSISQSSRNQKQTEAQERADRTRLLRLLYLEVQQNLEVLDRILKVGDAKSADGVKRNHDAYLYVSEALVVEAHRVVLLAALEVDNAGFFDKLKEKTIRVDQPTGDESVTGDESFTAALCFMVYKTEALKRISSTKEKASVVFGEVRGQDRLRGLLKREEALRALLEEHAKSELGTMVHPKRSSS